LRGALKLILINSSPKNALKIFQPFLPIFVPVGIGCLIATLEQRGIPAKIVDEQIEDHVLELIDSHVKTMEPPYIFGFSVLTAAFKSSIVISKKLKELYPDSIILFGGVHPTAMPEEVLSFDHIDYVLKGEAESSLVEFYKCIKNGKDVRHIENLCYRDDNRIVENERVFLPEGMDLERYPFFPYHLFDPHRYDLGFVISSRGCPYQCIFCSNRITTGRKFRFRKPEAVVEEIDLLCHKYNKRYVLFLDDNFLVDKRRIYGLMEEIRKKGLDNKMTFNFQARGDNADSELLKEMFKTGFRSIFFGLETASEEIMKAIKKGETVAQCVEAVRMAKQIGFHVSATFIYGLPGETHRDRMDCVRLSRELRLDMIRYNNSTPYPGTELYEIAKKENRLHIQGLYENFVSVSTFIENPLKAIPFSYVPKGNTEEEIRRDILFSYFSFYLDIEKLKRIFTRPEQGVGWFNPGERLKEFVYKTPPLIFLGFMLCIKFLQLFYYSVVKKETAISLGFFLRVFEGLFFGKKIEKQKD
jgi:anaerobic magnesium-protoporphyrin IX monomethyl ester cyclase